MVDVCEVPRHEAEFVRALWTSGGLRRRKAGSIAGCRSLSWMVGLDCIIRVMTLMSNFG